MFGRKPKADPDCPDCRGRGKVKGAGNWMVNCGCATYAPRGSQEMRNRIAASVRQPVRSTPAPRPTAEQLERRRQEMNRPLTDEEMNDLRHRVESLRRSDGRITGPVSPEHQAWKAETQRRGAAAAAKWREDMTEEGQVRMFPSRAAEIRAVFRGERTTCCEELYCVCGDYQRRVDGEIRTVGPEEERR